MTRNWRIASFALAAVLMASTAGMAAAQSRPAAGNAATTSLLAAVATNLGITPSRLTAAFQSAEIASVQGKVTAGHMSASRAKALEARLNRRPLAMVRIGLHRKTGKAAHGRRAEIKAAVAYLGVTPATLRNDRRADQSLSAIAQAQGKTTAGLVQAMLAPTSRRLQAAMTKGHMTAAREQAILGRKQAAIERMVSLSPHMHAKAKA